VTAGADGEAAGTHGQKQRRWDCPRDTCMKLSSACSGTHTSSVS